MSSLLLFPNGSFTRHFLVAQPSLESFSQRHLDVFLCPTASYSRFCTFYSQTTTYSGVLEKNPLYGGFFIDLGPDDWA